MISLRMKNHYRRTASFYIDEHESDRFGPIVVAKIAEISAEPADTHVYKSTAYLGGKS